MVDFRRPFQCEVITPETKVFAGEVVSAIFPAPDGLVGVLGGRGPLVTLLGSGSFTVRGMDGRREEYFVTGGFARFCDNALTLLAEECLPIEAIDAERAWDEIQQAQKLPRETPEQIALRDEALEAARAKFKLAQKFRKQAGDV
jgi:F-type H+-transporting ATPase subunit epsilon